MIDIEKAEEQMKSIVKSNTIETDETIEEIIRRLRPDADEDTVKYLASIGSDYGDGCWYWRTYCFVEKSSMIDGVRVLDRLPTVEEVRGCVLSDPDSYGDIVSTGRMTVICPTPCGFYDEDDWRWEVCYVELDDDGEVSLPDYVNGCTAHTLDEAIRFAIDELNSERIYIARESV